MGVQMQWQTKPLDFDVWVNWESFIFDKDTHQEAFTFGLSARYKETGEKKGFATVESGPLVRSSYHAEKHIRYK
jgi:hypothetical protein